MASEQEKKIGLDLTNGSVLKLLLVFALPIALSNIVQQFYTLVDMVVIGQYVGSVGTAGVSSGGEMVDLFAPIAMAFSSAGQILVAQLVGAGRSDKAKKSIGTLISSMVLGGLAFMAIALIFCEPFLRLINCPEEAFTEARDYMLITAVGTPFVFGYNAICGVLRGMGESRRPLLFICIAAVINVFLDILLMVVFPLRAAGCAVATVFAEAGSCIASFIYMYMHRKQFHFELRLSYFKIEWESLKIILVQGLPMAIRSTLVRFSLLWVNANINTYGLVATSTNGVGNRIQKFMDVFTQGLSQASAAMIGQNLGARKLSRASRTVWYTLLCSSCMAGVMSCFSIFLPRQVFGLFTSDPEVIEMGVTYMHMLIAHFFCSAVVTAFQSMVIGSGYASMNFAIGILDGVVCKIGLSLLFANVFEMGLFGYFWAIGFSRLLPGVICFIFFIGGSWKKRKLLADTG